MSMSYSVYIGCFFHVKNLDMNDLHQKFGDKVFDELYRPSDSHKDILMPNIPGEYCIFKGSKYDESTWKDLSFDTDDLIDIFVSKYLDVFTYLRTKYGSNAQAKFGVVSYYS